MASAQEHDYITPKMDNHSSKSVANSTGDLEKQQTPPAYELKRKLSSRHLQFVAIGTYIPSASTPQYLDTNTLQAELSVLVCSSPVEARSTQLAPQARCSPMSSSVPSSTRS